jgi:hypothetical protein
MIYCWHCDRLIVYHSNHSGKHDFESPLYFWSRPGDKGFSWGPSPYSNDRRFRTVGGNGGSGKAETYPYRPILKQR